MLGNRVAGTVEHFWNGHSQRVLLNFILHTPADWGIFFLHEPARGCDSKEWSSPTDVHNGPNAQAPFQAFNPENPVTVGIFIRICKID